MSNNKLENTLAPEYILIIDDDRILTELLQTLLEDEGYNVQTANEAETALDLISLQKPSMIFSDVLMPGMNGIELAHHLLNKPDTSGIPLVLMSAHLKTTRLVEEGILNDVDFIEKPFDLEILLDLVAAKLYPQSHVA